MKEDKLVRDKIPEIIKQKGESCEFYIADDDEYWERLKDKLFEEINEFFEEESKEELADVFEVLHAIVKHKKFDVEDIKKIRHEKRRKRGGFDKKIILTDF